MNVILKASMLVLETIFMHICFYSCSVINICSSSFSLFLALFFSLSLAIVWYLLLLFVLIDQRNGKKASYYCCCLFFFFSLSLFLFSSFSFSQPKILPASVHTHIYQSEEMRVLTHRFFFLLLVLAKFSPNITIILILLFAFAYAYVQE